MIFKTVPVVVKNEVLLYDMYVNGAWHGSRRTQEQCEQHFAAVINKEKEHEIRK